MSRITYLIVFFSALAQAMYFPSGLSAASILRGIYAGTDAGNCCWMGPQAQLRLAVPSGADTLLLNVYVPDFAAPKGGQSLRVQIGDTPAQERCCFGAGEHELAFALPKRGGAHGDVVVTMRAGRTFVPKEIGLNADPRHLSVLLRQAAFYNASTGERFDAPAVPGLPSRSALAVLALAGILVLALTLRRPVFGVAALILTDPFLLPYAIHGTTITLPKVALLAVAAGLGPRMVQIARYRAGSGLWLLLGAQLLFALSMLPGSAHATFAGAALRETLKAFEYAATLVVAYLAYRCDPDEGAVRLSLSIVTIAVTLLAVIQLVGSPAESEIVASHTVLRLAGPLGGPNQLAGFLGVVVPAMLAFAVCRPPLLLERLAIALGLLACLLTFSRAGVAALAVATGVLFALRYAPARRLIVALATGGLFAVLLATAFGVFAGVLHGPVQRLFGSGTDRFNGGLGSRIDLWHAAYAMWRSHPLFGIGAGNYEFAVGRSIPGVRTHANGMYFQVLAEQGVAGLLAMFAVVAASIGVFVRRLNRPLALGACMAAVAMAFHQIADCMWLYPEVGVTWWVLLALGAYDTRGERITE